MMDNSIIVALIAAAGAIIVAIINLGLDVGNWVRLLFAFWGLFTGFAMFGFCTSLGYPPLGILLGIVVGGSAVWIALFFGRLK